MPTSARNANQRTTAVSGVEIKQYPEMTPPKNIHKQENLVTAVGKSLSSKSLPTTHTQDTMSILEQNERALLP